MKLRKLFASTLIGATVATSLSAQSTKKVDMAKFINNEFAFAAKQYVYLANNTPANKMPQYYNAKTGKWVSSSTQWWCSGFYPGSLLYIYEATKDEATLVEAKKRLAILEPEKHFKGNHDLGFMMYCSFGNAYRVLGDKSYLPTIDTAAQSLATRYREKAGLIQSWARSAKWNAPVIIDNMMNLELLLWDSQQTGNKKLWDIAISHADKTLKNHFRPDYSSYHVVDYDMNTGDTIKKGTHQGYADNSAWARGQSWGLYGYTVMYRFTKDQKYLDQANHIADFIFKNPNLPKDLIPYWDFNAPKQPNELRDVSAATVNASALLELAQYSKKNKKRYVNLAKQILLNVSSDKYKAKLGENGGYILTHSVGSLPHKSEVDVPLTYADYYYLEALARYKQWYLK
jgi:uncharacterized protein YyaL (SSP411 family)